MLKQAPHHAIHAGHSTTAVNLSFLLFFKVMTQATRPAVCTPGKEKENSRTQGWRHKIFLYRHFSCDVRKMALKQPTEQLTHFPMHSTGRGGTASISGRDTVLTRV